MLLRQIKRPFVSSMRFSPSLNRSYANITPIPLVKPEAGTRPEGAIILKLSEALPRAMYSERRDELGVKFWASLNEDEQREILVAHHSSAQFVQKSPHGTPVNFISNQALEPECWVDASTKHSCIAVLINRSYITFNLAQGWDREMKVRSINWAETVGIELAVRAMVILGYSGTQARVHSDSTTALQAFSGTRFKRGQEIHESVDRSKELLAKANIMVNYVQVPSKKNIADAFTRGIFDSGYSRLACDIPLPTKLSPLLHIAP